MFLTHLCRSSRTLFADALDLVADTPDFFRTDHMLWDLASMEVHTFACISRCARTISTHISVAVSTQESDQHLVVNEIGHVVRVRTVRR